MTFLNLVDVEDCWLPVILPSPGLRVAVPLIDIRGSFVAQLSTEKEEERHWRERKHGKMMGNLAVHAGLVNTRDSFSDLFRSQLVIGITAVGQRREIDDAPFGCGVAWRDRIEDVHSGNARRLIANPREHLQHKSLSVRFQFSEAENPLLMIHLELTKCCHR